MGQAVMTQPGHIEFNEVEAPVAGPGEILLRVKKIGVCGSDIHVWHGQHPFTRIRWFRVMNFPPSGRRWVRA